MDRIENLDQGRCFHAVGEYDPAVIFVMLDMQQVVRFGDEPDYVLLRGMMCGAAVPIA
jgi:hypothetical protein